MVVWLVACGWSYRITCRLLVLFRSSSNRLSRNMYEYSLLYDIHRLRTDKNGFILVPMVIVCRMYFLIVFIVPKRPQSRSSTYRLVRATRFCFRSTTIILITVLHCAVHVLYDLRLDTMSSFIPLDTLCKVPMG